MLFDTHAHVLSGDLERYPYSTLRDGAKPPVSPMVFPVEQLVAVMDADDVRHACIVQRATLYGYDNRYALDAAAAYPDRFVPIIVLDGQDDGAPARLKALAGTHRLGGLRMVAPTLTETDVDWLAGREARALWAMASDLGLPVTVILYRRNNEAGLAALHDIARTYRSIPILIDHVGLPHASTPECRWAASQGLDYSIPPPPSFGIAEALRPFADLGHVHFKITDINFDRLDEAGHDSAAFVRALADRFGAQRLLWGSDVGQSPAPYARKIDRLCAASVALDAIERDHLFRGTAMRLYGQALATQ